MDRVIYFLIFGAIEVFILLIFYKDVCNINNIRLWHGCILGTLFFMFGLINFPFIKQISMICIMFIYLYMITKRIDFKITLYAFIYLLIIEATVSVIYENILGFNITNMKLIERFLLMIPIRFIEVFIIILYKRRKIWVGFGGEKSQNLKKQKKK